MKVSGDITGDDRWETSDSYQLIYALPAGTAIRKVIADFIQSLLNSSNEPLRIFSLAIGSGDLYKRLLNKEIENGKISVIGIENDKALYKRCIEEFPGRFADIPALGNIPDGYSSIIEGGLDRLNTMMENTVDIFEARFVISRLLFKNKIIETIEKISRILKPKGTFILSDIDNWIGTYIEKKIEILSRYYNEINIDLNKGILVCRKRATIENPILDKNNHNDKDAVKTLIKSCLEPLKTEAGKTDMIGWEEVVNADIQNALTGRVYYRTKDEWKEIIKTAFNANIDIRVISAEDIQKKFSDVINNPFLVIATKQK